MRQHALTHKNKDGTTNNGGSGGAGSGSSGSNQASPSHSTAGSMTGDMSATFKALSKSALSAGGVIPGLGGSDTGKFDKLWFITPTPQFSCDFSLRNSQLVSCAKMSEICLLYEKWSVF